MKITVKKEVVKVVEEEVEIPEFPHATEVLRFLDNYSSYFDSVRDMLGMSKSEFAVMLDTDGNTIAKLLSEKEGPGVSPSVGSLRNALAILTGDAPRSPANNPERY